MPSSQFFPVTIPVETLDTPRWSVVRLRPRHCALSLSSNMQEKIAAAHWRQRTVCGTDAI